MIFMYLGFLFLIFWSFDQARSRLTSTFRNLQKNWVENQEGSLIQRFIRCLAIAVFMASPQRLRWSAITLLGQQRWNTRWSLVLVCLSSLAVVFWAGLLSFVFQAPAGLFLLSGFAAILIPKKWPSLISFFWFVFFLGLFMHSMEATLRMSTFLGQESFYQDLVFVLADNRLLSVVSWLLAAAIMTFLMPFEGWTWILAVLGISLGMMGFNVAVALIVGESLGASLVFLKSVRRSAPAFTNLALQYFLVISLAAIIFIFAFGSFRSEFFDLSSLGGGPLPEKIAWFLITALAWSGFSTLCSLVWGHFKGKTPVTGSVTGEIPPTFVQ